MPCLLDFSYITHLLSSLLLSFIHSFNKRTISHISSNTDLFPVPFPFPFPRPFPPRPPLPLPRPRPLRWTKLICRFRPDTISINPLSNSSQRMHPEYSVSPPGNGVLFLLNDTFSSDDSHSSHRFFITCTSCKLAVNLRPTPFLSAYLKIILH